MISSNIKVFFLSKIVLVAFILAGCADKNFQPVADAGPDQRFSRPTTISLDATGSTDPDDDILTYQWSFVSVPDGSQAALSDATSINPAFTADLYGEYVLNLVVNDGELKSEVVYTNIVIINDVPVSNAGADQNYTRPAVINLNGTGSSDPDGDMITYQWSIISTPADSLAALSDSTSSNPDFNADSYGQYVINLIVSDGELQSAVDSVVVTIINNTPIADAGSDRNVFRNSVVSLNANGSSDPDGDSLSYQWSFASIPADSSASFSNSIISNPSFTADAIGEYVINLVVNDGVAISVVDEVRVTVDKSLIYSNDFSSVSLNDFVVGEIGSATVNVSQGKLQISPGEGYLNRGFVALNMPAISAEYKARLADNAAKIIWSFNVSNIDGSVCGTCNNLFGVNIFSFPDTAEGSAFGYAFNGGGYVGNRMLMTQHALANSKFGPVYNVMIDITNGLAPLPSIAAIKIIYDPGTNLWELYYDVSDTVIDPMSVSNMIGSATNNGFSDEQLPYLILSGQNAQKTFFDNLSVILEYK